MTIQTPRVSTSRTTLHLAPGTYKVADLLAALEAVRTAGQGEVDVTTYPRLPGEVRVPFDGAVSVKLQADNKFNQESLQLGNESPGSRDARGQLFWLNSLPVGSYIRDNTTRRVLRKIATSGWATKGGWIRDTPNMVSMQHTYTLIRRGNGKRPAIQEDHDVR